MVLPWSRYVAGSLGLLVVTVAGPRQSAPATRSPTLPVCCPQVAVVCPVSVPAFSLYVKLPTTQQSVNYQINKTTRINSSLYTSQTLVKVAGK